VRVRGGVRKDVFHDVTTTLKGGAAGLPVCDCIMREIEKKGGWCSHALLVPFLLQQIRLGFERLEYRRTHWKTPSWNAG
jgi:hypothetical protein